MRRQWWWLAGLGAVVVALVVTVYAVAFPARSRFLAGAAPHTCELLQGSPFGQVTSCLLLGRRTPLFGGPDGTVFALLETDRGPVSVRVEYRDTGKPDAYVADAVEVPSWLSPGISSDTGNRIKDGINQRGGLRTAPWRVHPATG